jgi:hypothetical protein
MEEMKWSSSGLLGLCVLTANNLGFGLALAQICQTDSAKIGHGMSKISLTQPS